MKILASRTTEPGISASVTTHLLTGQQKCILWLNNIVVCGSISINLRKLTYFVLKCTIVSDNTLLCYGRSINANIWCIIYAKLYSQDPATEECLSSHGRRSVQLDPRKDFGGILCPEYYALHSWQQAWLWLLGGARKPWLGLRGRLAVLPQIRRSAQSVPGRQQAATRNR